jgi:ABC-type branched-subunit amino acid transport system substrate-binding protein
MRQARGLQAKKWYDLFAKLKNEAGGWKIGNDTYQLQMVIYDSQGNATTAKDLLSRQVFQDGCKFLIGQLSTGSAVVDMTITEPNKIITIHEDLTNQAAKTAEYFYTTGNFFTTALNYKIAVIMKNLGKKTYCGVRPENQVGHGMEPAVNNAWAIGAPDMKWVGTVWVDPATIDYAPIATKIKSLNADVADLMYLGYIPNSVPQLYRALYDVGYKGTILPGLMSQADLTALVVQVGKAAVEGGVQSGMGMDPRTVIFPDKAAYIDAYIKEYGKWETDGVSDLNGFFLLETAINAVQSIDVEVVKAYLDNDPPAMRGFSGYTKLVARPDAAAHYRTNVGVGSAWNGVISDGKVSPGMVTTEKDQYLFTILSMKLIDSYKPYWAAKGYPKFSAWGKQYDSMTYAMLGITGAD